MAYFPTVLADSLELWIGSPATGRATASSTTLDLVQFTQLDGQPAATTFTLEDEGNIIAIIGGGPVDPLMPPAYFVQGAMFHTRIATYVSPTEVILEDAPDTSIYNSGFVTVICYRRCKFKLDAVAFQLSIAPGTRDTIDVRVEAPYNDYIERFTTIAEGQPVYFTSTDPNFKNEFGGEVDTVVVGSQPGYPGLFSWTLHLVSGDAIAARRCVPPALGTSFVNTAGDVVFTRMVLDFLNDEGVSVDATAAPDITIGAPVGARINQLLDGVVQALSSPGQEWYWFVDPWRKYVLRPRTHSAAPWDVDGGGDLFAGRSDLQVTYTKTHDKLANFVYVIGQNVLFNALNVTFHGDGGQVFNLPQAVATVPSIKLNGVAQTVGILGVETGKQWYWNTASTAITQDSSGTPISSGDSLVVSYQFAQPGVAQYPLPGALQDRSSNEANSGAYDYVIQISQPILPEDLLAIARSYAEQYGNLAQTIGAWTLRPGLQIGQLQHVTLDDVGADADFLISTIRITTDGNVIHWNYTAFTGANIGNGATGLVQFINRGQNTLALVEPVPVVGSGFLNSRPITIDHTQVPSDQTRFGFAFAGTYSWLIDAANGGNVQSANGYDIIFSSTPDGANPLPFQRVSYAGASGKVQFWVLIGTVSSTVDTVIYICWNNTQITTDQQNATEVWAPLGILAAQPNANFHGVYHLEEAANPFLDSSGYGNDSTGAVTAYPTQNTNGILGGDCQSFNGNQGIQVPATVLNNGTANTAVTFQAWIKTTQATDGRIISSYGGAGNHGASIDIAGATHSGKAAIVRDDGGAPSAVFSSAAVNDGNWHFICGVIGGTVGPNDSRLYVDGVLQGSPGSGLSVGFTSAIPACIGNDIGAFPFGTNGLIDEARILQYPLSADTIAAQYNNQRPGSTFYSVGNQAGGQTINVAGNPTGTVTHSTGALTADLPVLGNGGGDVKIGVAGQLVPAGGSTGQVLMKLSGSDYDDDWGDASESDILINGSSTLNIVEVNGVQVWQGQTDILVNGA